MKTELIKDLAGLIFNKGFDYEGFIDFNLCTSKPSLSIVIFPPEDEGRLCKDITILIDLSCDDATDLVLSAIDRIDSL